VDVFISELGLIPSSDFMVPVSTLDFYSKFKDGDCNVLAGEEFDLAPKVLEGEGIDTPSEVWNGKLSTKLLSFVTRDGDPKFSDFVNYILQSLMTAEEERVRRSAPIEASDLDTTALFGNGYQTMFQDAFAVVGHYGALYARHLEPLVSRSSANEINSNTAAMYSKPLGDLEVVGRTPNQKSPIIDEIKNRGSLIIGVTDSPMFSSRENDDWVGICIDFARAISAALFDGDETMVDFTPVLPLDQFVKLQNGDIHLLARTTTITMERDVKEPKTRDGFTFSSPMFHDQIRFVGRNAS